MDKAEIFPKFKKALQEIIENDKFLLEIDVNERCLTHRLAVYLEKLFPAYNVDCEYNREGFEPKKIKLPVDNIQSDDIEAITVYPDICIHKRGTNENLVIIEAKKQSINHSRDKKKLIAYKKQLGYKYSFLVVFPIGTTFQIDRLDEMIIEIE